MSRICLIAISAILATCTSAAAQDYMLRLETTGFRNSPQRDKQPIPQVLESIEVVARVNQPFHGSTNVGLAKISITGYMEQLDDGKFRVNILYRKTAESGESAPGPNGTRLPIMKSMNIDTMAVVEFQKTTELAKDDSVSRNREGAELATKTRTLLSLNKFDLGEKLARPAK